MPPRCCHSHQTDREDAAERHRIRTGHYRSSACRSSSRLTARSVSWSGKDIFSRKAEKTGETDKCSTTELCSVSTAVGIEPTTSPLYGGVSLILTAALLFHAPISLLMCAVCVGRSGVPDLHTTKKSPGLHSARALRKDLVSQSLIAGTPSKRTDRLLTALGRFGRTMPGDACRP